MNVKISRETARTIARHLGARIGQCEDNARRAERLVNECPHDEPAAALRRVADEWRQDAATARAALDELAGAIVEYNLGLPAMGADSPRIAEPA